MDQKEILISPMSNGDVDSSFSGHSTTSNSSRHRMKAVNNNINKNLDMNKNMILSHCDRRPEDQTFSSSLQETIVDSELESEDNFEKKTNWLAYLVFFLLGVGMLFPWNIFINCHDYFAYRLRGSSFADNFDHYYSNSYTISNVLMLIYLYFIKGNALHRMWFGLTINALVFLTAVIGTCISGFSGIAFFLLHAFLVVMSGVSVALLQNGVFGIASLFPQIYIQSIMSGQGLAGATVAISHIVTISISASTDSPSVVPQDEYDPSFSTCLYFAFAFLVILFCLGAASFLQSSPIYLHFYGHTSLANSAGSSSSMRRAHNSDDSLIESFNSPASVSSNKPQGQSYSLPIRTPVFKVFWKILPMAVAVFLVFFVTLSVFPPIIAIVEPLSPSAISPLYFNPVSFLIFALGDWLGKSLPGFSFNLPLFSATKVDFARPSNATYVLLLSIARFIFIPLFLMMNLVIRDPLTGLPSEKFVPTLIRSDAFFMVLLAVFSITNGWFGSLAMMHAPKLIHAGKSSYARVSADGDNEDIVSQQQEDYISDYTIAGEKQDAGTLMVFCLTCGLAFGSLFSFFLRSIICGWCNPFIH